MLWYKTNSPLMLNPNSTLQSPRLRISIQAAMTNQTLPETQRALVVTSTSSPLTVQTLPTPKPSPGSAVVRILAANVISYSRQIYNGERQYPFPTPFIPGASAIGRVAAVGPDATLLRLGMLVFVDCTIRGRDDATATFLSGIHEGYSEGSRTLMRGEWKDSTYAEYAKVPLETCEVLDEGKLCGRLGYSIADLACISAMLVPYGGLRDIDLKAGETVIVSPATGAFGGAAVFVALAMGARVIAMGRNVKTLETIKTRSERIETVPITGDVLKDLEALKSFGAVDAFFDISPPVAGKSTHIKSGILALKRKLSRNFRPLGTTNQAFKCGLGSWKISFYTGFKQR